MWDESPQQPLTEYEVIEYTGSCGFTVTDAGTAQLGGSYYYASPITYTFTDGPPEDNLGAQTIPYPELPNSAVSAAGVVTFVCSSLRLWTKYSDP